MADTDFNAFIALWTPSAPGLPYKWSFLVREITDDEIIMHSFGVTNTHQASAQFVRENRSGADATSGTSTLIGVLELGALTEDKFEDLKMAANSLGVERPAECVDSATWDPHVWVAMGLYHMVSIGVFVMDDREGVRFGGTDVEFDPENGIFRGLIRQIGVLMNDLLLAPFDMRGMGNTREFTY